MVLLNRVRGTLIIGNDEMTIRFGHMEVIGIIDKSSGKETLLEWVKTDWKEKRE